jgi:hypothetical protein
VRSLPIAVVGIGQSRGDDDDVASVHRPILAPPDEAPTEEAREGIQTFPVILWNKIPAPRIGSILIESIDVIEQPSKQETP